MENFEFKSQVCTDKNQSRKLLELGLKKETADCMHNHCWTPEGGIVTDIPAWSLHRLLVMYGDNYSFFSLDNAYSELIHAIAIDIENGDFNKDYLEEKK